LAAAIHLSEEAFIPVVEPLCDKGGYRILILRRGEFEVGRLSNVYG